MLKKYFGIMLATGLVAMIIQMLISWSLGLVEETVLETPMMEIHIAIAQTSKRIWHSPS